MTLDRRQLILSTIASAMSMASAKALSADWPTGPIRFVIGYPPGGAGDVAARLVGQKLSQLLGQPVVVENKPGANGTIAANFVAKAASDGNTILVGGSTELTIAPTVMAEQVQYVVARDFAPLCLMVIAPSILTVPADSRFSSVDDMLRFAKSNPGHLTFASFGSLTTSYLAAALLQSQHDVKLLHVPFKGSAQAITELMAGRVDMFFDTIASAMPRVKAGRLRALAVTSEQRSPLAPEIPTMRELGFKEFVVGSSVGLLAPAATPASVVARLQSELQKVMVMPDVQQQLTDLGMIPIGRNGRDYATQIASETAQRTKLVREGNLKLE